MVMPMIMTVTMVMRVEVGLPLGRFVHVLGSSLLLPPPDHPDPYNSLAGGTQCKGEGGVRGELTPVRRRVRRDSSPASTQD